MPNWCYNEVYFVGGTKKQRKYLYEKIKSAFEKSCFPEADEQWIGNLSVACGIPAEEVTVEKTKYQCRAFVVGYLLEDDHIELNIESAWSPIDEYLKNLFSADLPALKGMDFIYEAEETSEGIWVTNDVYKEFITAEYYYDDYEGKLESQHFDTEDELLKFVNSKEFKTAHRIEKEFKSYDEVDKYTIDHDCNFTVREIDLDL